MVSIAEIYDRLSPEPLQGDDLQRYYVDSFAGRGDNPMISLKRLLLEAGWKASDSLFRLPGLR